MDLKSGKIKHWVSMFKDSPSTLFLRMEKFKRKCKRDPKTDP